MGYTIGPMTVGEGLPMTPKPGEAEGKEGVAMNPGDVKAPNGFSPRTAGKFKSFKREGVPKTGNGSA
jgi:hypothetical protein